jgi:hypothetical protein
VFLVEDFYLYELYKKSSLVKQVYRIRVNREYSVLIIYNIFKITMKYSTVTLGLIIASAWGVKGITFQYNTEVKG